MNFGIYLDKAGRYSLSRSKVTARVGEHSHHSGKGNGSMLVRYCRLDAAAGEVSQSKNAVRAATQTVASHYTQAAFPNYSAVAVP